MQPRAKEVHEAIAEFTQAKDAADRRTFKRRGFTLVVQGSNPQPAELREFRPTCAMIDVGASIFTLAYSDVLALGRGEDGLRITVRAGGFASHAAARLRRQAPRASQYRRKDTRERESEFSFPVYDEVSDLA